MEGAALQHEALGAVGVHTLNLTDLLCDLVVVGPGEVQSVHQTAPGVEGPVRSPETAFVVHQEGGAAVPDPGVVADHLHYADVLGQPGPGVLELGRRDHHGHLLKPGDGLCHVGKHLLSGLGAAAPVVVALRPDHPRTGLLFKLAGHPITILFRGGVHNTLCHLNYLQYCFIISSGKNLLRGASFFPSHGDQDFTQHNK